MTHASGISLRGKAEVEVKRWPGSRERGSSLDSSGGGIRATGEPLRPEAREGREKGSLRRAAVSSAPTNATNGGTDAHSVLGGILKVKQGARRIGLWRSEPM